MINDADILFAGLRMPALNKLQVLEDLRRVPEECWTYDAYRGTSMLPIMTRNGLSTRDSLYHLGDSQTRKSDFHWTGECPAGIKDYFEKYVFTWVPVRPRIVILKTPPRASINVHIDCQPEEFGSRQLKFRYVLQGSVSSLYFVTNSGNVFAPQIETPFIIDGSWPHGMRNDFSMEKITICLGAPWTGSNAYPDFHALVERDLSLLPKDHQKYFKTVSK